jgi:hypothetical protein
MNGYALVPNGVKKKLKPTEAGWVVASCSHDQTNNQSAPNKERTLGDSACMVESRATACREEGSRKSKSVAASHGWPT